MTRENVPPICKLCGRVKVQRIASTTVRGEGSVMNTYWICETCDVGSWSRPAS